MKAIKLILMLMILAPSQAFCDPVIDTDVNGEALDGLSHASNWNMPVSAGTATRTITVAAGSTGPGSHSSGSRSGGGGFIKTINTSRGQK